MPTVLVTGANGYIGHATARAFQRAGYTTYGLIRSPDYKVLLEPHDVIPIVGDASKEPEDVLAKIKEHTQSVDVIVSTTTYKDTIVLIQQLAKVCSERPLVLFTSGSKDYGQSTLDGDPSLKPHTEESPLNPPPGLAPRTEWSLKIFNHKDEFDAAVLRPTNVHGHGSSLCAAFFVLGATAAANDAPLLISTSPKAIAHSMHVDDCGEAYVALAKPEIRSKVANQTFNISAGTRYETMKQIADATVKSYGLKHGVKYEDYNPDATTPFKPLYLYWTQWLGSEKIRSLTGWSDSRPMFAEGYEQFRKEYEEALKNKDKGVLRIKQIVDDNTPKA